MTFEDKFEQRKPDECWPWKGTINQGYGRFQKQQAHRIAVLRSGRTIPDGLVVDHVCRNKSCVNPSHLRVVTQRINCIENSESPPAKNIVKTHCPKGHPYNAENTILRDRKHGLQRSCRECANEHLRSYNAKKRGGPPIGPQKKSHCKRGHELNELTTRKTPRGRSCLSCERIRDIVYRKAKHAK